MPRFLFPSAALSTAFAAFPAMADVPNVVTDIAPVHSLVATVMGDLGAPELLVDPGSSPHSYALRPSQARALDKADLVVWIGEPLTPWLHDPLETLAGSAAQLELLEADGTFQYAFREDVVFAHSDVAEEHAEHDHDDHDDHDDHAEHGEDDHGHDEKHEDHDHDGDGHQDHAAENHEDHHDAHDDDHADEHDHGHDHAHDHEGLDPHAWLDPENGRIWLGLIAEQLATLDPENAATYRANAAAGQDRLAGMIGALEAKLEPLEDKPFVVFHDAYQYFETRFHLRAVGAIRLSDASDPSPARIAEIQEAVAQSGVVCAFSEPQYNPRLIQTVFAGTQAKTAEIDPLGLKLAPGAALYPALIEALANEVVSCLE